MTERQYVYKITEVVKVTDGDTYWLRVDVGFRQQNLINVRLHGYDCPEARRGSDYEKTMAMKARDRASDFFFAYSNWQAWIQTHKDPDSFGRWLGDVWLENLTLTPMHLGEYLRQEGLASIWPTRWREEYDTA